MLLVLSYLAIVLIFGVPGTVFSYVVLAHSSL